MKILVDAERLNTLLASKGMNANTFAQEVGMSFVTMYRICRGGHAVSSRNAKVIADGLGVPFEHLFKVGVKNND